MSRKLLLVNVSILCSLSCLQAADWPAFRGPRGDGISDETKFPTKWSDSENVSWRVDLPVPGNSSPIVSNGRVFVTCAEDKKGHRRSLYCFDRNEGKQLWVRTVDFDKDMPTHKDNLYCGATPAANSKYVVAWHASAGLYCYDFAGNEQWSRDLGEFEHMWGYGSSPVIHDDQVILHCGPGERIFLTSIDLKTGQTNWETDEPHNGKTGDRRGDGKYMGSWSMPVITKIDGRLQVVCTMPTRVNGYDLNSGKLLWTCDGIRGPKGDLAYSSPLISDGFCVATGGFSGPSIGFRVGGMGNITEAQRVWRSEKNPQSIGSGVFIGKHIFKPNAGPGTIQCLEAATGNVVWTDRAAGANHWGSIVAAADLLYVTNQDGTTVVFKASPDQYEEVAQNKLGLPSNSTPAFSDGQIFIRTSQHLFCIGE